MTSTLFLRIAAVIALLNGAGHTAGAPWTPATETAQLATIEAMKSQTFAFEGVQRTYWSFYFGFGVIISVFLFLEALVLWQLGTLARTDAARLQGVIAAFLAASLGNAYLGWRYFFAIPTIMSVAIALCLGIALILAGKAGQEGVPRR